MAQSSLSLGYDDYMAEVGHFLGYGRDSAGWGTAKTAEIDGIVQSGVRQFYYPPPLGDNQVPHVWTFLRLSGALSVDVGGYNQPLPDDFGGVIETLVFSADAGERRISIIDIAQLRSLRADNDQSGAPKYAAVYPYANTPSDTRYFLDLYPTPDQSYTLTYRYNVLPDALSATSPYPLGGMAHNKTVLESCLAVAEERMDDHQGVHATAFLKTLTASIALDRAEVVTATVTWPVTATPTGLELVYSTLAQEVGAYLGYGFDQAAWTYGQNAFVDSIIQRGVRQFYNPPPLPGQRVHVWTFLRPVTSLVAFGALTGATLFVPTYDGTNSTVTRLIGFYPSMVGTSLVFATSGNSYVIVEYLSSNQVLVSGDASSEGAYASFTVAATGDLRLPASFGGIDGTFTFDASTMYPPVKVVGEGQIRRMRQQTATGRPRYAAIRPLSSDGTTSQQFEAMVWPTPDADYTLNYRYNVRPQRLTDSSPYPLGGQEHSETILASCLAMAEQEKAGNSGPLWDQFLVRLTASVEHDRQAMAPEFLGYNSDAFEGPIEVTRVDGVTYNNVLY